MSLIESERARARAAVVDEHIRCENSHDLDALMATFGIKAQYDDEMGGPPHWPRWSALVLQRAHARVTGSSDRGDATARYI